MTETTNMKWYVVRAISGKENKVKEYIDAEIKVSDLDNSMPTILKQINKVIGKDRFNHYRPANKLNQLSPKASDFSKKTLDRYEKIFIEINKLY